MEHYMQMVKDHLNTLGYDRVEIEWVALKPNGEMFVYYRADDDFQENLDWHDRCAHGFQNIYFRSEEELIKELNGLPTREEREFKVLLRRTAGLKLLSDTMVSAAGRAFHAEMVRTLSKYKLLEDRS